MGHAPLYPVKSIEASEKLTNQLCLRLGEEPLEDTWASYLLLNLETKVQIIWCAPNFFTHGKAD